MSKKRKQLSKRLLQRIHAKKRLEENHGIFCNGTLYKKILEQIRLGKSTQVMHQSHSRRVHRINIQECDLQDDRTELKSPKNKDGSVTIYVVYDKSRKELNTVLPWFGSDEAFIKDYYENDHVYKRSQMYED